MGQYKTNHLAIWASAILIQILGFAWYSPFLFGARWMGYLGKSMADFNRADPRPYVLSVMAALALAYLMSWAFNILKVDRLVRGLILAMTFWFCFHFAQEAMRDGFAGRPAGLSWVDGGFSLVAYLVCGALLSTWKKKR